MDRRGTLYYSTNRVLMFNLRSFRSGERSWMACADAGSLSHWAGSVGTSWGERWVSR